MRSHDNLNIKALVMLVLAVIFAVIIFIVASTTKGATVSSTDTDKTGAGIQTDEQASSIEEKSTNKTSNTGKLEIEASKNITKHEKADVEHHWYSEQGKKAYSNDSLSEVTEQKATETVKDSCCDGDNKKVNHNTVEDNEIKEEKAQHNVEENKKQQEEFQKQQEEFERQQEEFQKQQEEFERQQEENKKLWSDQTDYSDDSSFNDIDPEMAELIRQAQEAGVDFGDSGYIDQGIEVDFS